MSISFDAASGGNFTSSVANLSHTIGTGANFLATGVGSANKNLSVSNVDYNAVPATVLSTVEFTGGGEASAWKLINPSTGTNNDSVTYNSGTVADIAVGAISLKGVNVASPTGATGSNNNSSVSTTSSTINLTTQFANSWIIDVIYMGTATGISAGGSQTQRVSQTPVATTSLRMSTQPTTTAGSYSMTWNFNNADFAHYAFEVRAASDVNAVFFGTDF